MSAGFFAPGSEGGGADPATLAGAGLVAAGAAIAVGAGSYVTVNANDVAVDVSSLGTYQAGAGLVSSSGVLAVGAGSYVTVNANDVAVDYSSLLTALAGDGLNTSGSTLNVGIGSGINVGSNSISVAATDIAGPGLTGSGYTLTVGAGTLVSVGADDVSVDLSSLFSAYIDGFIPEWVSSTVVRINPNNYPGQNGYMVVGGALVSCSSGYNIDITTDLDTKSLTGTFAVTSGQTTFAGTSTLLLTELNPRLCTGTAAATASTTITGTGTRFLEEYARGDLWGNSTDGFYRITEIQSHLQMTISTSITITNGVCYCIENPVIRMTDTAETRRINSITSNTAGTVTAAWGATDASTAATVGNELASTWYCIWPGASSGKLSTQRTTKYNNTTHRRRCAIYNNSSGDLANTTYKTDGGNQIAGRMRSATLQYAINNVTTHATNWAIGDYSAYVPPTAVEISEIVVFCGDSTDALAFKELPASGSYDALESYAPTSVAAGSRVVKVQVGCRGQAVAYASYSGSASASNYVTGTPGKWVEYA